MPHDPPPGDAVRLTEHLLAEAARARASDVHVEPTGDGAEVRARVDGLLGPLRRVDRETGRLIVNRLMVMAGLLTYRLDVPQEGRFSVALPDLPPSGSPGVVEMRLAVMPTTHGLRAAVRLPADLAAAQGLGDLGLPTATLEGLHAFAAADAGLLLLAGPAGSGKTTTIYALLAHLVEHAAGQSIVSVEDPVERDLPGVTQIEVRPFGELTYPVALRSVLRQDPQVLAIGEVRDRETALLAAQAAMTGHRLVTTLHAGSPGGAIVRLIEMGVEPYQVTSGLFGVVSMRLVRRRCEDGYRRRTPVAEFAALDEPLRRAILAGASAQAMDELIRKRDGHESLRDAAAALVRAGVTDEAEVGRVLGVAGV